MLDSNAKYQSRRATDTLANDKTDRDGNSRAVYAYFRHTVPDFAWVYGLFGRQDAFYRDQMVAL